MKRLLCISAALLFTIPAFADIIIDFGTGTAGNGGTIALSGCVAGTCTGAVGTAIPVNTLTVTLPNGSVGVYDLSGAATSTNQDANKNASLDFKVGTAGNTITVKGGVAGLTSCSVGTCIPLTLSSQTLLTGTFTTFTANNFVVAGQVSGSGPDTKSVNLLSALGLPTNQQFVFFDFDIAAKFLSTNTFQATSTDIGNTGIPEPTSIVLLGTILVGITHLMRRRPSRQV